MRKILLHIRTYMILSALASNRHEKMRSLGTKDLKNNHANEIINMNYSYDRERIRTFSIDQRSGPIQIQQTIPSNKEVKMIHPGFSAGKLENQNGFTNVVNNTSIFSISIGGNF